MERNAAHGCAHTGTAVSLGKRQLKYLRSLYGIVKEHLIEIAEPVEQERITEAFFHLGILLHHRRQRSLVYIGKAHREYSIVLVLTHL